MLAAILATRRVIPPPTIFFYSNQLVAVATTFSCMFIAQQAAFITTSVAACQILNASTLSSGMSQTETFAWLQVPGQEALSSILRRYYNQLRSSRASNDPAYLSSVITQVVSLVRSQLIPILQSLPVAPQNITTPDPYGYVGLPVFPKPAVTLSQLQQRAATALAQLQSLGVPVN